MNLRQFCFVQSRAASFKIPHRLSSLCSVPLTRIRAAGRARVVLFFGYFSLLKTRNIRTSTILSRIVLLHSALLLQCLFSSQTDPEPPPQQPSPVSTLISTISTQPSAPSSSAIPVSSVSQKTPSAELLFSCQEPIPNSAPKQPVSSSRYYKSTAMPVLPKSHTIRLHSPESE